MARLLDIAITQVNISAVGKLGWNPAGQFVMGKSMDLRSNPIGFRVRSVHKKAATGYSLVRRSMVLAVRLPLDGVLVNTSSEAWHRASLVFILPLFQPRKAVA